VRQIETLASDALAALAPFGVQEGVELNIGASHTICVYLLPKLLPMLVRDWPKQRIHVVSGTSTEILNALATHQASIGLIEAPGHRPDLKIEAFSEDELSLIPPPSHRWAKKTTLRAAEIVQEPILLRESGSGSRNTAGTSCVLYRGLRTPERSPLHCHQFTRIRDFGL
jgi:DNA-binding transcriptional LysR family regulator